MYRTIPEASYRNEAALDLDFDSAKVTAPLSLFPRQQGSSLPVMIPASLHHRREPSEVGASRAASSPSQPLGCSKSRATQHTLPATPDRGHDRVYIATSSSKKKENFVINCNGVSHTPLSFTITSCQHQHRPDQRGT